MLVASFNYLYCILHISRSTSIIYEHTIVFICNIGILRNPASVQIHLVCPCMITPSTVYVTSFLVFHTKVTVNMCIYRCHIVSWRINKLLLPHNLYSGVRHIPLLSQRPFLFHCSFGTLLFGRDKQIKLKEIKRFF